MSMMFADLTDACGTDPGLLCRIVYEQTSSEFAARLSDGAVKPFKILLIFLAAWMISRVMRRVIDRFIERMIRSHDERVQKELVDEETTARQQPSLHRWAAARAAKLADRTERGKQRTQTLGAVLKSLAAITIYTIALIMALNEVNIDVGPLIAGAGIVGVALGFGAQRLVQDFLSGIFMLIEDQYGVGDIVDIGEAAGVVEAVSLRTTQIRDVNGTLWHVPNGEVRRVGNKSQQWARAVLDIEVAYDTDLDHAMGVIKASADTLWADQLENATILEEPEIWGVESFGANAIAIRLALKVEPAEQWATAREMRRRLKDAFEAESIEIPFPQRTVWLNQDQPKAKSTPREVREEFQPKTAPEGEMEP